MSSGFRPTGAWITSFHSAFMFWMLTLQVWNEFRATLTSSTEAHWSWKPPSALAVYWRIHVERPLACYSLVVISERPYPGIPLSENTYERVRRSFSFQIDSRQQIGVGGKVLLYKVSPFIWTYNSVGHPGSGKAFSFLQALLYIQ